MEDRFDAEVDHVVSLISANPSLLPILDRGCRAVSLRKFSCVLIYRMVDEVVQIVGVAHTKQSSDHWADRL